MDNRKFEKLIDLIINEDQEQAKALFHDIVVEKSREIYESLMEDDINDMIDDISAEEDGNNDMDSDMDSDVEFDDGTDDIEDVDGDFDGEEFGDEEFSDDGSEVEELEDRVVDLEDKLDELMAEFEEMMGSSDDMGDEEFGDEEFSDEEFGDDMAGDEEFGDEEFSDEEFGDDMAGDEEFDDEEALAESVELQRMKGLYDSKIGGDDGAYTRSPALTKPKVVQTGANPVNFTSGEEKGRSAPAAKQIPGQYKNAAGIKSQDGESAPKATTSQASGVNTKSPVAESKRTTRKPVARQYK
jgi:hypothetical protein